MSRRGDYLTRLSRTRRSLTEEDIRSVLHCSGFGGSEPEPERERDTIPAPPPVCECFFPDQAPPLGKEWTHAPGCPWALAKGRQS